ncbi:MAG: ABC transporter substrate-binding protein [Kiritimatiellaeota bacterium]|nr:ABC transporter substrate-binding protein [Kiritimatiellota bacterium]
MKSRMVLSALAASALVAVSTSCSNPDEPKAEKIRIGVSIPSADHGWTGGAVWWAQKSIAEWKAEDADLVFHLVTADSATKQVADVEDLMVKGIDALVIMAHDSAPLTPVVASVAKKGIFVVSVDRGLTQPVENVYVAGDNPGLGRVSGEWMAKALDGKGDIVVLEGIPCVINTERVDAFMEVIKEYPDITVLDSQPAYWSTQKGLEIMENYLQKHPTIDAVWAQDDDVLKGVLQAYKESGRDDIAFFLGGAGSKEMIKKVLDNDPLVKADVTYPPAMIAKGIEVAVKALRDKESFPARIIVPSELVTPDNAKDYYYPDSVF